MAATPAVKAWLQAQGNHARLVLDRIDGRQDIARRLAELTEAQGDAVRGVMGMPGERWATSSAAPPTRSTSWSCARG